MINTKCEHKLHRWLEKARLLDKLPITIYVNEFVRGKDAIINTLSYTLSNCLAEASVNKAKKIKKIMNGRCNFETWRT